MPSTPLSKSSLFSGTLYIPCSLCSSNHVLPLSTTLLLLHLNIVLFQGMSAALFSLPPLLWSISKQLQLQLSTVGYLYVPSLTFIPSISVVMLEYSYHHLKITGPMPDPSLSATPGFPSTITIVSVQSLTLGYALGYLHSLPTLYVESPLMLWIICLKSLWGLSSG